MSTLASRSPWIALAIAGATLVGVPTLLLWPRPLPVPATAPAVTAPPVGDPTPVLLKAALSTPIFSQSRAFAVPPSTSGPSVAAPPAATPPPELVGVLASRSGGGIALLRPAGGTATTVLAAGETIGPWRLVHVSRRGVVMRSGVERLALALDVTKRSDATPEAASAPVPDPPLPAPPTPEQATAPNPETPSDTDRASTP